MSPPGWLAELEMRRYRAGLGYRELAKLAGSNHFRVTRTLTGATREPSIYLIAAIAEVLGCGVQITRGDVLIFDVDEDDG